MVDQHPDLEIVVASSRALKGKKISDVYPADVVAASYTCTHTHTHAYNNNKP